MISLNQLIPTLQLATGPVILISGIGLLLLSFTNRLGRLIDRARSLHRERVACVDPKLAARLDKQIVLIDRRAGILRRVITLAAVAVLLVAVLILVLFVSGLFRLELGAAVIVLFSLVMVALIGSMAGFISEMNLALEAVRIETRP
jgi:hypothetical protein